jgi:hypothetical protein
VTHPEEEALGASTGFDAGERETRDMKEVFSKLDNPKVEEQVASMAGDHGDPDKRQAEEATGLGHFCPSKQS